MENLINEFASKMAVTEDLPQLISEYFEEEQVLAKTVLSRSGHYCRKLFFVESGMVRTFYDHDDQEVTSWFYYNGFFVTAWHSFIHQSVSYENIETLEDSRIYSITYSRYQELLRDRPEFERYGRILVEEQLAFIDLFSKGYMFLTARERYDRLLEFLPDIELRVKLGYIASFLGISQATLSRLRAGN